MSTDDDVVSTRPPRSPCVRFAMLYIDLGAGPHSSLWATLALIAWWVSGGVVGDGA